MEEIYWVIVCISQQQLVNKKYINVLHKSYQENEELIGIISN